MIKKYLNQSMEDIELYLGEVKRLINEKKAKVLENVDTRKENYLTLKELNFDAKDALDIIYTLNVYDFCYSCDSYTFKDKLYVFIKELIVNDKTINLYIKMCITESDILIIISFHEPHKNMKRLFNK